MAASNPNAPRGAKASEIPAEQRERRIKHPTAQDVLAATRRILTNDGLAAATVVGIERAANVAPGTVRYYFATRDGVLEALLRAEADKRLTALRKLLAPAGTLDELHDALTRALFTPSGAARTAQVVLRELDTRSLQGAQLRRARENARAQYSAELARQLEAKAITGIVSLPASAEAVADLLIAIGEGVVDAVLARPGWDAGPTVELARHAIRALLTS